MRLSAIFAAFSAIALTGLVTPSASALAIYDGFDYANGNLPGNTNSFNLMQWTGGGSGGNNSEVQVVNAGSLAPTDAKYTSNFPVTSGKTVGMFRASNKNARLGIIPDGVVSSGALYYSLLMNVADFGGLSSGTLGVFLTGFNNSDGTATSAISRAGARLHIRQAGGSSTTQYELGIRNDVGADNGTSAAQFDTSHQFTTADTVFLVAKYQFNTGSSSDDVASLWINPDPSTFGTLNEPTPDATSTGGDISQLQIGSFFFYQRLNAQSNAIAMDELRIADTWDAVTSIPEPGSLMGLAFVMVPLLSRTRRGRRSACLARQCAMC
jgi:hypothetical protein